MLSLPGIEFITLKTPFFMYPRKELGVSVCTGQCAVTAVEGAFLFGMPAPLGSAEGCISNHERPRFECVHSLPFCSD